jgi:hypothetical protein
MMACSKYVEAVFGTGLVSNIIMEHLHKDLIGDLVPLLVSVYSIYNGNSYRVATKCLNAKNIIIRRLPEALDKDGSDTNNILLYRIILTLSTKSEFRFIEWYTRDDLSFLEKLKIKRIMKLFLEVKDKV